MSGFVAIVAIVGMVAIVAVVCGRGVRWRADRTGMELQIPVEERAGADADDKPQAAPQQQSRGRKCA